MLFIMQLNLLEKMQLLKCTPSVKVLKAIASGFVYAITEKVFQKKNRKSLLHILQKMITKEIQPAA